MELAQKLFQVTSEVAGLREKLQNAEEGKQDAVRKMEAAWVKREIVQCQMAELGGQKHADVSMYPSICTFKILLYHTLHDYRLTVTT